MLTIEHVVACAAPGDGLQLVAFCRRRLDAAEASIVASRYDAGASDTQVEDLFTADGKTSKSHARKKASRGKAVHANPDLGSKLADGDLSTEQTDLLADAADETDGAAACDEELIEAVSKVTPEQGKRKAKDWVTKRKSADDVQDEHDEQHRNRAVHRVRRRDGRHWLIFESSETDIDAMERRVGELADVEFRADGGRDVPRGKHPRTLDQRRFDGAKKLFTNSPPAADGSLPAAESAGGTAPAANPGAGVRAAGRRSTMFVTLTLDQLTGVDRSVITTCDGRRLPPSVVEQLACESDLVGVVFDEIGEVLWQGRKHRRATPAQVRALIARDGGCVQCHAHHDHCVAHHILPWEAPRKGESNIDNLALLCERCHVRLHQLNLTLVRNIETRNWETRPATPAETPPKGGPNSQRGSSNGRGPNSEQGRSNGRGAANGRGHGHRQRDRTVRAKPRIDELRRNLHQGEPSTNLGARVSDDDAAHG